MNLIVAEVYDALIEAGASEAKAKAAAGAIPVGEQLATQQDLSELRAATQQDLSELRAATKQDLSELRAATKQDLSELRAELKNDIGKLTTKVARLEWAIVVVLALLIKLVFFSPGS